MPVFCLAADQSFWTWSPSGIRPWAPRSPFRLGLVPVLMGTVPVGSVRCLLVSAHETNPVTLTVQIRLTDWLSHVLTGVEQSSDSILRPLSKGTQRTQGQCCWYRLDGEFIHIVTHCQREITRILKKKPPPQKILVFWFWFNLIEWLPFPDRMRWLLLCRPRSKIWLIPAYSTGGSCKGMCHEM